MFEFAVSQHSRQLPSRRLLGSWVISCLLHGAALVLIIENPHFLRPGEYPWLRHLETVTGTVPADDKWRTVAILQTSGPMQSPSLETLRKYAYDWSRQGSRDLTPPVRVRWGNEDMEGATAAEEPVPSVRSVLGTQEPKLAGVSEPELPYVDLPVVAAGTEAIDSNGKGNTIFLPTPPAADPRFAPKGIAEEAPNTEPTAVARLNEDSATATTAPESDQPREAAKLFEDEQKAIRSDGSGLFDTKGFPLGDYANIIIDRIKSNWFIPSNMRNSRGNTTVIFYIERDGRFSDARIVASSGSSSLDLAALNAVIGSNPFPPLPEGFPADHVGAKFVFSYNERR